MAETSTSMTSTAGSTRLLRRVLMLRGALERIGLFHADMNIPRECKEALDEDEKWHTAEDRGEVPQVLREAREATLKPGELEQLRRIDRAARDLVDKTRGLAGAEYEALCQALFDDRPSGIRRESPDPHGAHCGCGSVLCGPEGSW